MVDGGERLLILKSNHPTAVSYNIRQGLKSAEAFEDTLYKDLNNKVRLRIVGTHIVVESKEINIEQLKQQPKSKDFTIVSFAELVGIFISHGANVDVFNFIGYDSITQDEVDRLAKLANVYEFNVNVTSDSEIRLTRVSEET